MKRKHKPSLPRPLLVLICCFLGIVLALMVGFSLLIHHLAGRIHYREASDTPTLTQEELDEFLSEEIAFSGPSKSVYLQPMNHSAQISGRNSGIVNILLIGQDRRERETRARSDSMILCTFQKEAGILTMTSFLRDLYVEIPGYRDSRINAAYAAGGMPLLKQTFQKNFGIYIDGCVEVDFNQFAHLIDMMGGVSLELRQDEADFLNASGLGQLYSGCQLLNGNQALAYARIRMLDADGDFSRTNRQRKIIEALIYRCKTAPLSDTLAFLRSAMPLLTTDMRETGIVSLARELLPMLPQMKIVSQHIPTEGTYIHKNINGMAVLVADMAATRTFLEESLSGN